ncbi:MAG: hypothetical protein PHP82_02570 [Candidatus ainarchaeum sp.]|nr:hypothetical protein [Candidatus ainarchaeum sp.]
MVKINYSKFGLYSSLSNGSFRKKYAEKFFSQKMRKKPVEARKRFLKNFEKRVLELENNLDLMQRNVQLLNDLIRNFEHRKNNDFVVKKDFLLKIINFREKLFKEKNRLERLGKLGEAYFEDFKYKQLRKSFSENVFLSKIHISYRIVCYLDNLLLELEGLIKK